MQLYNDTSNQLVPSTSNNGQVYVDPDSSGYVNHVNIYNASGGHVHISGGGAGSGTGGYVSCEYCGESFGTQAQKAEHRMNKGK
ncbi:MAG: hypothetical protein Q9215_005884, partial [Flavoplaca cf. flavocitrina]